VALRHSTNVYAALGANSFCISQLLLLFHAAYISSFYLDLQMRPFPVDLFVLTDIDYDFVLAGGSFFNLNFAFVFVASSCPNLLRYIAMLELLYFHTFGCDGAR
jgi:hypothetical protein